MTEENLAAEWRRLKAAIEDHQHQVETLAVLRKQVTLEMYALPGMTDRKLGELLGVSGVAICLIRHLGEPKSGRILKGDK